MKIKKLSILFIIFTFVILAYPFTANAVVNWTKDANNPVLPRGGSGAWDEEEIESPVVIKDGATYEMWYDGGSVSGDHTYYQIGYATSSDGTDWTKDGSNPVLPPSESGWDSKHVGLPWVIKQDSSYKMWYTGSNADDPEAYAEIGYATSDDGITWSKYGSTAVLPKGGTNDWDATGVMDATVIYDEASTTYKMWYVGYSASNQGIGYATSPDGVVWTKYNNPDTTSDPYINSDPVINLGPGGSWKDDGVFSPTVIKEDGIYRMWYDADQENGASTIGYAHSIDGINWREYNGNPVIMQGDTATDDFDENSAFSPMVLKDGNTYKMWYAGDKDYDPGPCVTEIGYATSQAYQGSHLEINQMTVRTANCPSCMEIFLAVIPEGPSPLDINELKVEGPSGFSYTFSDWNIFNFMGRQIPIYVNPQPVNSGQYTFSVKANNGQSASNSLDLTAVTIPWPRDGSSNLDRRVNDNTADKVYAGGTTPTFKWKPCVGTGYYYRVWVTDWKNRAIWWVSDLDIGTTTDAQGYMSATVPQDILKPNTPYWWQVQVFDSNNLWSALNSSISNEYYFYTGTKSATGDFLRDDYGKAFFRSERSFRSGDRGFFGAFVQNLAPWDIDTTTNKFRVDGPGTSHDYDFSPGNDAHTTDPFPFMYFSYKQGFPTTGTYNFYVYEDGSANFESASKTFTGDNTVPRVYREEMSPSDNAYLSGIQPTLTWKSKGSDKWHRVMIFDWNHRRLTFSTDYMDGVAEGQDMSVQIPEGTLKEHSPYRWWVEVYDTNKNNRTRSQWLSFMTGENILASLTGTWGFQMLEHNSDNTWHTEINKMTFNDDGTGILQYNYNNNGSLGSGTRNFTYTVDSNADGSLTLLYYDSDVGTKSMRFVLSDDGKMMIVDGTDDPTVQTLKILIKLDATKTYTNSDLSGDYYNIRYEHNYDDAIESYWAGSGLALFNGSGSITSSTETANRNGTVSTETWGPDSYSVASDGSISLWNDYSGSGYLSGNGNVWVFPHPEDTSLFGSIIGLKKGDTTYSTADLAGTWAIIGFGDDGGTSFNAEIGDIIIDANGNLTYSFKNQRDGVVTYESGADTWSVSEDGSFGASLASGAPYYAGAIGNDGNTIIFNASFDQNTLDYREIFIGVRCSNCSNLAGASISADEQAIRTRFHEASDAWNNKDIDTFMSFFSSDYLDDGEDYAALRASELEEFADPDFSPDSYTLLTVSVDGSTATTNVTWADGETETMHWIKETDGVWRMYGNQKKYGVDAWSQNWHYGQQYMIHFKVEDPNHTATSVTITGIGITGSLSLDYDVNENTWNSWHTNTSLDFGANPPTPPLTYTFTIVDSLGTNVYTYDVRSFVSVYTTNLSPSGTASDPLVFLWTGVGAGYTYQVQLSDADWNRIWDSDWRLTTTSVSYDGDPLTPYAQYHYWVVVEDQYGNESFAEGSFTQPAALGDVNGDHSTNLADAILSLQVMAGMNPDGIRTGYATSGADVNEDGKIGLAEVIYILQHVAGLR